MVELLLYLAILSIILAGEICLIGFTKSHKQKADDSIMVLELEEFFMYSREYSLANDCRSQIVVDCKNNIFKLVSNNEKIKELSLENLKVEIAEPALYEIGRNGHIACGNVLISSNESKRKFKIIISVGTDNIRIIER